MNNISWSCQSSNHIRLLESLDCDTKILTGAGYKKYLKYFIDIVKKLKEMATYLTHLN
jgi:hypothetical protein